MPASPAADVVLLLLAAPAGGGPAARLRSDPRVQPAAASSRAAAATPAASPRRRAGRERLPVTSSATGPVACTAMPLPRAQPTKTRRRGLASEAAAGRCAGASGAGVRLAAALEEGALGPVGGAGDRRLVGQRRLGGAAKASQQVGTDGVEQVVAVQVEGV